MLRPVVKEGAGVDRIAAGVTHSAMIAGKKAYVWGQLGTSDNLLKEPFVLLPELDFVDIVLGEACVSLLTTTGDVYTIGQLVPGTNIQLK